MPSRVKNTFPGQGFFGIGIMHSGQEVNIGTLWRSAYIMGASFIFTIDKKYKAQSSDMTKAWTKIPLYHYESFEEFKDNLPFSTRIVALELCDDSFDIVKYSHPERAVYLLGNEQSGLSKFILKQCHQVVALPGDFSLNVAVAGSLVIYDRLSKLNVNSRDFLPKRES